MSKFPSESPWGAVKKCDFVRKGIFGVNAEDGGGIMVHKNAAEFLSPEARKIALNEVDYLCFAKGGDEAVVFRELLDNKMWRVPHWVSHNTVFEDYINNLAKDYHPKYWEARQARLSAEKKPKTLTEKLEAGKEKAAKHNAARKTPDAKRKTTGETEH